MIKMLIHAYYQHATTTMVVTSRRTFGTGTGTWYGTWYGTCGHVSIPKLARLSSTVYANKGLPDLVWLGKELNRHVRLFVCLFVCLFVQYDCRQCYIPCMAGAVVCWWVTMATGELYLEYSPFCLQYSDVVQSHCPMFCCRCIFCTYHSGIRTVSDLSCIRSIWGKGQVATRMSSVELFAVRMKIFDGQKLCLITWSFPSETFDWLIDF